jgi:chromosome segregation ATPase
VLLEKEKTIEDQRAKIAELQSLVKEDHTVLKTLDQTIQNSTAAIRQSEDAQIKFQRQSGLLNTKLAHLTTQHGQSMEQLESAKRQVVQLNSQCVDMESELGRVNSLCASSETQTTKLQNTFLELTSDVRALEIANQQLVQFKREHNNDEFARKVAIQKSTFQELQLSEQFDRETLFEKDTELRAIRAQNLETEVALANEVQRTSALVRRSHAVQIGIDNSYERLRRDVVANERAFPENRHRTGPERPIRDHRPRESAEMGRLTARVRDLEHRIHEEKSRMATAQETLHRARVTGHDPSLVTHSARTVEASTAECLALQREKRALEAQIDRLRQLSSELRDELDSAERVAEHLRRDLVESRRRPIVVQPLVVNEADLDWRGDIAPQLDRIRAGEPHLEAMQRRNIDIDSRMRDLGHDVHLFQDVRNTYFPRDRRGKA